MYFCYCKKNSLTIKKTLAVVLACGVLFCGGQTVSAQPVELIVRTDDPSSELAKHLRLSESSGHQLSASSQQIQTANAVFSSSSERLDSGPSKRTLASTFQIAVRDSSTLEQLLSQLRERDDVTYAHPNVTFTLTHRSRSVPPDRLPPRNGDPPILSPENILADSLNHLEVVGAVEAWQEAVGDSTVRVGVVDTGVYLEHPDLAGQLAINEEEDLNNNGRFDPYPSEQGGDLNGVDDDGNGYVDDVVGYDFVDRPDAISSGEYEDRDPDPRPDPAGPGSGHGTAVAGVVAAAPKDPSAGVAGVAPGVSIVPLRAFGGDGRGQADDIAAAIVYGATLGLDVLNLSFGRDEPVPVIEDAIEYATDQGTVVVAAAGNELTDAPHYPSDYPEVLSVAWLAEDGEGLPDFNRSQYGIGIDIGAPGTNVFSTRFPRNHRSSDTPPPRTSLYSSNSGSSFSAPQVAGAAALLRSADSSLSPASIRSILTSTAADLNEENWDVRTGAGRLDAQAALLRSYPARTEITTPSHNGGTLGESPMPVIGSAVSAEFESYALYFAEGTRDLQGQSDPWREIQAPVSSQQLQDTLGVWDVASLSEGPYTLRLVTRLTDGSTVEDRRRVYVDRTPPRVSLPFLGTGRVEGANGIIADVESDDPVRLRMTIEMEGRRDSVQSESRVRRQGIAWADARGTGGTAQVTLRATNPSGLTTTIDTALSVPPDRENTALLRRTSTSVPRGHLLPQATDFDGDGLRELVMNQDRSRGGVSDTIRSFEWAGEGFAPADTLRSRSFPRDLGDSDDNGRQELLFQIRGETTIREQPSPTAFPTTPIFTDTAAVGGEALRGALLADLTGDGRDDLLAATDSSSWRVLRRRNGEFQEAFRLSNPTSGGPDSSRANVFGPPTAATGDFDEDGTPDLLVGDRDGDLIVFEASDGGTLTPVWTHETNRIDAGRRFGVGDVTGDGQSEFVTMSRTAPTEYPSGGRAPSFSYYSVWKASGPDSYQRRHQLPVVLPPTNQGAIQMGDLDGDARQEVVIAHPPSVLVLDWTNGRWRVLHENQSSPSILTPEMVVSDFSGDGRASVIAGAEEPVLQRYVVDGTAVRNAPPQWARAHPLGADAVQLAWQAPGADSVEVFAGSLEGGELHPVRITTDSSAVISGASPRRFTLRAWRKGEASPLSPSRSLRPHDPATVTAVEYPEPSSVKLRFSEPLPDGVRAETFAFGEQGRSPERLVQPNNRSAVVLQFPRSVAGTSGLLHWPPITDASGLPIADTTQSLSFPAADGPSLFVEEATILSEQRVQLRYSAPVPPAQATDPSRYRVRPRGRVDAARMREESERSVLLHIDGLAVGATGQEASLTITDMVSTDGRSLAQEGGTVRLTRPAGDLDNVFVYPNPHRAAQHGEEMTVAGLPSQATIRVYSPEGRLVDEWTVEDNPTGGSTWDLRDRRGQRVPSGIYLFRIEAPEQSAVLKKAAVLR